MFNPIDIVLFLLGLFVLPLCLLVYGLCVIGFYVRSAKKRKTHLRNFYVLAGLSAAVWLCILIRPTGSRIQEEVNSSRSGSVVQITSPGGNEDDTRLFVRDYALSRNKLIDLNLGDTGGTDGMEIPRLFWSLDNTLLIADFERKGDAGYDFIHHKIVNGDALSALLKPQKAKIKQVAINLKNEKEVRQWESLLWD